MQGKLSGFGFIIFWDHMNRLQVYEVSLLVSPTIDNRIIYIQ
jgi:hypothetical protein